jgi:hypothetical protein
VRGNAVLLEITGPGPADAYGDAGTGAAVWVGRLAGHLEETNRQVVSRGSQSLDGGAGGQTTKVETTVLHVIGGRVLPEIQPGEASAAATVLLEDRRPLQPRARRFQVIGVERYAMGARVDSIRLELGSETQ